MCLPALVPRANHHIDVQYSRHYSSTAESFLPYRCLPQHVLTGLTRLALNTPLISKSNVNDMTRAFRQERHVYTLTPTNLGNLFGNNISRVVTVTTTNVLVLRDIVVVKSVYI